jgi:hypothetical protein
MCQVQTSGPISHTFSSRPKTIKARKHWKHLDLNFSAEFSRHARGAAFSVIHLKATKAAGLTSTVDSGTKLQL